MSSVQADLKQLLELQSLEQTALAYQKQIELLVGEYEHTHKNISQIEEQLRQKQQSIQRQETEYQHCDLQLKSLETTLKKQTNQQQFSQTSKAFHTLEASNAELYKKIESLEIKMLAALDQLDLEKTLYKEWLTSSQQTIKQLQVQAAKALSSKKQIQTLYQNQCERMQAFERPLKNPFYEAYINLRNCKKMFPIIVPITRDNQCSSCHLQVPVSITQLLSANVPQFCDHCGRMLFYEPPCNA